MKEKKNIDRLFQEKFKDFEHTPKEDVWKNIAEKLQEKQEKKPVILPLWYKLGGVAAVLAIILAGVYFLQNSPANFTEPQITFDIEESQLPSIKTPSDSILNTANKTLEKITETSKNSSKTTKKAEQRQDALIPSGAVANQTSTTISGSDTPSNNSASEKTNIKSSNITSHQSKNEQDLAHLDQKNEDKATENQSKSTDVISLVNKTGEDQITAIDSVKTKADEDYENAVALFEKEKSQEATSEEVKTASKKGKVSISPFAAPVYYDNLGSGNPIDPSFASNQTSSEVTMAYGVKVAYAVSEKIKIRSGINKVSMNYQTRDIAYNYAIASSSLASINYDTGSENIRIASNSKNSPASPVFDGQENGFVPSLNMPRENGSLSQNFGYIEVPVEIEYNLIDKKIGLKLIGGASSLFLDENSVSVNGQNGTIELGESNNLESLSFTTNIGMGIDYQLNDKFRLNLEPTFKYQLNSFSNTNGVNPYFFGVYTGFSFEF